MKALVTGHMGFVGRHVTRALRDRGFAVTGIDIAQGQHRCDARDFFRVDTTHYDLVVHLAAVVGGRRMIEDEPLSVAVDLSIDAEMFGWALRTKPGRVIYFSSSAAYPIELQTDDGRPLVEDDIDLTSVRTPDLTYGWAKLTGEILARHAQARGLAVTVLRPFSGYGEDQDLDYPFPAFIDRARRRLDPFVVWGDGQQTRDFIHIDDIVRATLVAFTQGYDGPVNLGTGREVSFLELAQLVCDTAGYTPAIITQSEMPTGVRRRVADVTRMTTELLVPRITLEVGVTKALLC